jgi:2-methylcitrate dehydratase PrpD
MNDSKKTAVQQLGEFAYETEYKRLPSAEQMRTKLRLLNLVGAVFAATRFPGAELASAYSSTLSADGESSFWLADRKGRMEDAAFVNGILSHCALLDDTVTHTGTILIPAALAVAEDRRCSGEEVLAALAVGYEIAARVEAGLMLSAAVTLQGFRHSWPAVFGAAAASAKLMGLSAGGIADAMALMGTLVVPGTMAWYCNWPDGEELLRTGEAGLAERYIQLAANTKNAVLAATLAEQGFHGSNVALEGECGVYAVYANGRGLPPELVEGLGEEWHLGAVGVKPYPGSWVIPIYCAQKIVDDHPTMNADDVARVEVDMVTWKRNSAVVYRGPFRSQEQALVSTPFSVAATLISGRYDMGVLADSVGDPRVDALAANIDVKGHAGAMTPEGRFAKVEVVLKDGTRLVADASSMELDRVKPDSWEAMADRIRGILSYDQASVAETILECVGRFDGGSGQELVDLLREGRSLGASR